MIGRGFDTVADLYDEVRPHYPDELYDAVSRAVGALAGCRVLDLAAGTGIATRALLARGASVVALEPGLPMLRRLRATTPAAAVVAGLAESVPLRDDVVELVVCATAWHWLDTDRAVAEVSRVLRPGGHLALWWANNRHGDTAIPWESSRDAVYERWSTRWGSRAPSQHKVGALEAAGDLRRRGLDVVVDTTLEWARKRTAAQHVQAVATHSDVIALGGRKQDFLDDLLAALSPYPVVTERLWGPLVVATVAA